MERRNFLFYKSAYRGSSGSLGWIGNECGIEISRGLVSAGG